MVILAVRHWLSNRAGQSRHITGEPDGNGSNSLPGSYVDRWCCCGNRGAGTMTPCDAPH